MRFPRITVNPDRTGGVPCIRGFRLPVATFVSMVADEKALREILHAYPDLGEENVHEALRYATETFRELGLPLVTLP